MRSFRFGQVGAAPPPTPTNERRPVVTGGAFEGPALPTPGVVSRAPAVDLAYTIATDRSAADVTGEHGLIVAQPGTPTGVQLAWDGPRRMTYRLPAQPWAEGLIVDDYTAHARNDGVV